VLIGSVVALSLALRLIGLSSHSLWFDEAVEYWTSAADLGSLFALAKTQHLQPPLFSLLLHYWLLVSDSVLWIRLLSVLLSTVGLVSLMVLARRLLSRRAALVAGVLFATLPASIDYSREASEYALLLATAPLFMLASYRAFRADNGRKDAVWVLCGVLTLYSQYGGAILVVATGGLFAAQLLVTGSWRRIGRIIAFTAVGLIMSVPLAHFVLYQGSSAATSSMQPLASLSSELALLSNGVARTVVHLSRRQQYPPVDSGSLPPLALLAILVALVLASRSVRFRLTYIWIGSVFGLYVLLVRFSLYGYGIFGLRYSLFLLPGLVLLFSALFHYLSSYLGGSWAKSLLTIVVTALLAAYGIKEVGPSNLSPPRSSIEASSHLLSRENTQALSTYLGNAFMQGDEMYVLYGASPAFRYYAIQDGLEHDPLLADSWILDCWSGVEERVKQGACSGRIAYGAWIRGKSSSEKLDSLLGHYQTWPDSLWVVSSHMGDLELSDLLDGLQQHYIIVDDYQVNSDRAILLGLR